MKLLSSPIRDVSLGTLWAGDLVVYDGLGIESEPASLCLAFSCQACGAALAPSLRAIVLGSAPDGVDLTHASDEIVAAFGLERRVVLESLMVLGARSFTPRGAIARCAACGADHLVVVAYGEYQPARYLAFLHGVGRVDRRSP